MLDNEPTDTENTTTDSSREAGGRDDGQPEPAPARRRRRTTRSTATDAAPAGADPGPEAGADPGPAREVGSLPGVEEAPAAPAAAVKATRSRRRKAAPEEPVAEPAGSGPAAARPATDPPPADPAPADVAAARPATDPAHADAAGAEPAEPAEPDAGRTRSRARGRAPAANPTAVLFMPPEAPVTPVAAAELAEPRLRGSQARSSPAAEPGGADVPDGDAEAAGGRRRRRSRRAPDEAPEAAGAEPALEAGESAGDDEEFDGDEAGGGTRRRRRGRRGRGRGKGGLEGDDLAAETANEPAGDDDVAEGESGEAGAVTRRRRRRRRKGAGDVDVNHDDGVPTVIKIREPRVVADQVQGLTGSTRLEAKRQRRRDGREHRRSRPPILSESEFLARREAVDRVMVIRQLGNARSGGDGADLTQIAVLEDGVLVEHYVSRASTTTMAGSVYLGKVQNVLPSMEAAFVDVGRGRNAVLYAGEVNWDVSGLEGKARSIEQALKSGDSVLVQVTKDPVGHKGARLTSHIALSGRHLVYVPNGNASGISRKLPDTERRRLRDILKGLVPEEAGVIVRTAAEGASEDELARDVKRLQAQWEEIREKAATNSAPALLYAEPDLVVRVVRDLFNEDFREMAIQGDRAYETVEGYLSHVSPDLVSRLRRYTGTTDIFAAHRIDEQIIKALDRKVYLPSGGHLVVDRTEAMTVIDVNTGKYTGAGGNLEETVTRNNLEAAEELVRQMRLRDIGGIVVIDFIDMVLESNRELLLRRLTECLGRDRTKHQVTEITSLGLVQMTRKRIGAGLLDAFSEPCECCKGRGVIVHTEPVTDRPKGSGAAEKVKAVASAGTATASRRRGRRGAGAGPDATEPAGQPAAAEGAAEGAGAAPAGEADVDTMGYDLSRYQSSGYDAAAADSGSDTAAGAGDGPGGAERDAAGSETAARFDDDGETPGGVLRRFRRGGGRRRTRP
jgi:ribonuclease E